MTDALAFMKAQFSPPTPGDCPAWCHLPPGHAWDSVSESGQASRCHFSASTTWTVGQGESWTAVAGVTLGPVDLLDRDGAVSVADAQAWLREAAVALATFTEAVAST